ncbi:HEAT repeat-containing protein 4 isoform X4 [Caretta caretta]|uniref:HEAT repeat-containing protein 4 isoform X4 n=1 Tax=Caretta caretta TaxID=8467 RepID=UPI003F4BA440
MPWLMSGRQRERTDSPTTFRAGAVLGMKISAFYNSNNPFPLDAELRVTVSEDSNDPAGRLVLRSGSTVSCQTTKASTRLQDFCLSKQHYKLYQKKYFLKIATDLRFSKEVVKHRGLQSLPYKEYDFKDLYNASDIIQKPKRKEPIAKKVGQQPFKLSPLKQPPRHMKLDFSSPKDTRVKVPMEERLQRTKLDSSLKESSLPPITPSLPCESPATQTFLTESYEMLSSSMTRRQAKRVPMDNIQESKSEARGWEQMLLEKLNRSTAQWIVNQQSAWGGWIQGNVHGFKKQKFDWNRIRDELSSESELRLLDAIQAEEDVVEVSPQSHVEKKPETLLPVYYRVPAYCPRVLWTDDPVGTNSTAHIIGKKCLRPTSLLKNQEQLNSHVGKYFYTTKNAFEQELYFGTVKIVHQVDERGKDHFILENHDEYYKHLQQHFPRPPEHWSFKAQKGAGNSADSWAAAQCLALEGIATFPVVKKILSQMFDKNDSTTEEQACLLLTQLSECSSLVYSLLAAKLNSCQWKDRILACRALSRIRGYVSQDLKNKLAQLMWNDWNMEVRQAAALALGQMKLGKEVHDQLRVKLNRGDCRMKVEALSLIGWLRLMTAKLLPGFLQCFSNDFVAVRREACLTAGALRIKDEMVLTCLFKMMQTDPHWKIKAFAIRALGQIGHVTPQLKHHLLWAVHHEEEPGVRREACRSIVTLQLQDESVRAILLERLILEPNEMVREEMNKAVKVLNFQHTEEQEMIQKIKNEISRLSQKDLVTRKLLKLEEIIGHLWQEANRIYHAKEHSSAHKDILQNLIAVLGSTFSGQSCSSRMDSPIWTPDSNLPSFVKISSRPWTREAILSTLGSHHSDVSSYMNKL